MGHTIETRKENTQKCHVPGPLRGVHVDLKITLDPKDAHPPLAYAQRAALHSPELTLTLPHHLEHHRPKRVWRTKNASPWKDPGFSSYLRIRRRPYDPRQPELTKAKILQGFFSQATHHGRGSILRVLLIARISPPPRRPPRL